ncbi:MAG: hypothetical protein P1U63_05070 [Coxiellaceae bacterium]|nr:hypothetical protein [Coxiellaceae bacterium]
MRVQSLLESKEAADGADRPSLAVNLPTIAAIQVGVQQAKLTFDNSDLASTRRFDTNGHAQVDLINFSAVGATEGRALYASIDLIPTATDHYKQWLMQGFGAHDMGERGDRVKYLHASAAIQALQNFPSRSSIISLQQESEMHMRLSMRCVQANYGPDRFTDKHLQVAFEKASLAINIKVREIFCKALLASTARGQLDLVVLNTELDKARKKLLPDTKIATAEALLSLCVGDVGVAPLDTDEVNVAVEALESEVFTHITATDADYVFTDNVAKSCVWVEGTSNTAHNKIVGEDVQARRQFKRFAYEPSTDTLDVCSTARVEARVPSLSPSKVDKPEAIIDVAAKLAVDQRELSREGYRDSPMVYNLLTSLNSLVYDKTIDSKNRQRQSAKRILMAAHRFNRDQLRPGRGALQPFCLVANIPVNQHTDSLTLKASSLSSKFDNDVLLEASLMADMAILTTLNQRRNLLPDHARSQVEDFNAFAQLQYKDFLLRDAVAVGTDTPKPVYFYKSKVGKTVVASLRSLNAAAMPSIETSKQDPIESLVTKVVCRMHATGEYRNPKFGLVVQAMLVFLQDKTLYGCKSANERFKAVEGRVDLLHVLALAETHGEGLSDQHSELRDALRHYCNRTGNVEQLQVALDGALDAHCLYGAGMFVSSADQGGSPKTLSFESVSRSPSFFKSPKRAVNTNYAETSLAWKQTKASKWQAHKGDHAGDLKQAWSDAVTAYQSADESLDSPHVDGAGIERVTPAL